MQRSPYRLVTFLDDAKVTALISRFTKADSVDFRARYSNLLRRQARCAAAIEKAEDDKALAEAEANALDNAAVFETFEEDVITRYLQLAERVEIRNGDTVDGTIQTGGEIVAMYAGDRGTIKRLFTAVVAVNTFNDAAKKEWRQRHDSTFGLDAAGQAIDGLKRSETAAGVSRSATTPSAAARPH